MGSAKPALGVQRRMQAELARLGFDVCARTVARYVKDSWHPRFATWHFRRIVTLADFNEQVKICI